MVMKQYKEGGLNIDVTHLLNKIKVIVWRLNAKHFVVD